MNTLMHLVSWCNMIAKMHSMNETEVIVKGYSWGTVDLQSGKTLSVAKWFRTGTHYQNMLSQPLP